MSLNEQVDGITERVIAKADAKLRAEIGEACRQLDELVTSYVEVNGISFGTWITKFKDAIFNSKCGSARAVALQTFLAAVENFETCDKALQAHQATPCVPPGSNAVCNF